MPWTSLTLPEAWEPVRIQGFSAALCPAGHGPHFTGLLGPNKATVGTPSAAAAWVIAVSGPT